MMEIAEVDKRSQLLKIHIPILINFLGDEKLGKKLNQFERQGSQLCLNLISNSCPYYWSNKV